MRIYLAQFNPKVGDLEGNLKRAKDAVKAATKETSPDLVVFPEMSVCGYPPNDLLDRPSFVDAVEEYAGRWADMSRGASPAVLFGSVRRVPYRGAGGKKLQNVAVLADGGRVAGVQAKSLLPTYDVFSEDRYFAPADFVEPITLMGRKLGVCVCEDVWNDKEYWKDERFYDTDPVETLWQKGAQAIINISASPFSLGKPEARQDMLTSTAKRFGIPLLYVNQVGGNDDVVYDGSSMVVDSSGTLRYRLADFDEDGALIVMGDERSVEYPLRKLAPEYVAPEADQIRGALILGVRDYARKCGFKKAVLGLSGGIDSAVTCAVASEALGPENVLGIAMPSRYSSEGSVADAKALAENLGIRFEVHQIGGIYDAFLEEFGEGKGGGVDVALENLQARIRGAMLMAHSNRHGSLLLTTGNKSETAVGYSTLYGDTCGGLAVISDVYKTKVYGLARRINERAGKEVIPASTIEKPPSAELRPDQKDSDSLLPYEVLDPILEAYIEGQMSPEEIKENILSLETSVITAGGDEELCTEENVARVCGMVIKNEYKRKQLAPGLRVTSKAFGTGRRMPIAHGWQK